LSFATSFTENVTQSSLGLKHGGKFMTAVYK